MFQPRRMVTRPRSSVIHRPEWESGGAGAARAAGAAGAPAAVRAMSVATSALLAGGVRVPPSHGLESTPRPRPGRSPPGGCLPARERLELRHHRPIGLACLVLGPPPLRRGEHLRASLGEVVLQPLDPELE